MKKYIVLFQWYCNYNFFFLQQLSQNYEDHDSYMEIDASPYIKDSKDGITKGI